MPGGYAWWYLDGLSDDGRHGITAIAFIGSVFSPYYARTRRRGGGTADPTRHCAINVALYGPGSRWAMTERSAAALQRTPTMLRIGPSQIGWHDDVLVLEIDEWTVPWPRRLRGTVRLQAPQRWHHPVCLAADGAHWWHPIAPAATIEVDLREPALSWRGTAYLDANHGDAPLESAFRRWDWSRAHRRDGGAVVLYDVTRRDGSNDAIALAFEPGGDVAAYAAPPPAPLPRSGWGIARNTRCDVGAAATVADTLTDAPFYARSLVRTQLGGEPVTAMHESLSLERFDRAWVQAMLPFKMPRRG